MEKIFGDIVGVKEGDLFKDRKELRERGIHLATQAGIDGNSREGAYSIVLNGGYVDDYDLGEEIIYTGHGGNDPSSKRQVANQSWDAPGNKGLIISELHGLPVRVTRGFKHKSEYSPIKGYKYGGLYMVTEHFEEIGKDGFLICRYRLEKTTPLIQEQKKLDKLLTGGSDETKRVSTTTLRIVRDTLLCKEIKELYDYKCQICEIEISVRGVKYAEAAHIKPLGKPHNGNDKSDNIVCLCPNHHVMLDKGVFTINPDYSLEGIDGNLNINKNHTLDQVNLEYHNEHIFIND